MLSLSDLYEDAVRREGKRGTLEQAEKHAIDAAHAFVEELGNQWGNAYPTIAPDIYYTEDSGSPNKLVEVSLYIKGVGLEMKFSCSIGFFGGQYTADWKVYEPYGTFGQSFADPRERAEFERLGLSGSVEGSRKKVLDKLLWSYSKIRTMDKQLTRMASEGAERQDTRR